MAFVVFTCAALFAGSQYSIKSSTIWQLLIIGYLALGFCWYHLSAVATKMFNKLNANDEHQIVVMLDCSQGAAKVRWQHGDYQLLPSSRLSFIGCWLELKPISLLNTGSETSLFIARQFINQQQWSQLSLLLLNTKHAQLINS